MLRFKGLRDLRSGTTKGGRPYRLPPRIGPSNGGARAEATAKAEGARGSPAWDMGKLMPPKGLSLRTLNLEEPFLGRVDIPTAVAPFVPGRRKPSRRLVPF